MINNTAPKCDIAQDGTVIFLDDVHCGNVSNYTKIMGGGEDTQVYLVGINGVTIFIDYTDFDDNPLLVKLVGGELMWEHRMPSGSYNRYNGLFYLNKALEIIEAIHA